MKRNKLFQSLSECLILNYLQSEFSPIGKDLLDEIRQVAEERAAKIMRNGGRDQAKKMLSLMRYAIANDQFGWANPVSLLATRE